MSGPFRIYPYEVLRMVEHFRSTNLVSTSSAARSFILQACNEMEAEQKTDFIYLSLLDFNDSRSGFSFHRSCLTDRILGLNTAITVTVRCLLSLAVVGFVTISRPFFSTQFRLEMRKA